MDLLQQQSPNTPALLPPRKITSPLAAAMSSMAPDAKLCSVCMTCRSRPRKLEEIGHDKPSTPELQKSAILFSQQQPVMDTGSSGHRRGVPATSELRRLQIIRRQQLIQEAWASDSRLAKA